MEQLRLKIIPRWSYADRDFIVHAGVRSILELLLAEMQIPRFSLNFVHGLPRSGKTHMSVFAVARLCKLGLYPKIICGSELIERSFESFSPDQVLIVDDADLFLTKALPGSSGPFVNLVEGARRHGAKLLFLSSLGLNELPCDDHIMSRLRAGFQHRIEIPGEHELAALLERLALQRGIKLSPRNINFILRRLGRDIPSVEGYLERLEHLSHVLGQKIKQPVIADAVR